MFSSKELLHLVFADETDTYYGDDLLKLELNQYLWLKLHESYQTVYFLGAAGKTFTIKTYGDVKGRDFAPARGIAKIRSFLKGADKQTDADMAEQGDFLLQQLKLKRSEAAAFVCPLEDFCEVLAQPGWGSVLENIASCRGRTGIFVLKVSPVVEKSRDYLLHSPVFSMLRDTGITDVRGGAVRPLYPSIWNNKGEACVFLNTFSRERIESILLHVMLDQDRFLDEADRRAAAVYLTKQLQGPLEKDGTSDAGAFLRGFFLSCGLQFRELYECLKDERVWEEVLSRCRKAEAEGRTKGEGNLASLHLGSVPSGLIYRDKSCFAGRCLAHRLSEKSRQPAAGEEREEDILLSVQRELMQPKNRDENVRILAKAETFLGQLPAVSPDDAHTGGRILQALRFCVNGLYAQENSDEEKKILEISEKLIRDVEISSICFGLQRDLRLYGRMGDTGALTDKKLRQLQDSAAAMEKMRQKYQDLVDASIIHMSMPSFSGELMRQLEDVDKEVQREVRSWEEDFTQEETPGAEADRMEDAEKTKAGPEEEAAGKSYNPEDYVLDERDYSYSFHTPFNGR